MGINLKDLVREFEKVEGSRRLKAKNVDFARGLIHVMNSHREHTKSEHSRSIPMKRIAREPLLSLHIESGDTEYVFVNRQTGKP